MSTTSDILASPAASAFAQRFFDLVRATSGGEWVRYRDVYNRTVAELPTNAFVRWLAVHPQRRAKLKYVLEIARAGDPKLERRKDGTAQSATVWYRDRPAPYVIITDLRIVAARFAVWRRAMMHDGRWAKGVWETPEGVLAVTLPLSGGRMLGHRVGLGYDPTGATWTLQINQPTNPATHNVHSALATSPDERPALLRQGTLQRNRSNAAAITGDAFRVATGLRPVEVDHNGQASPRKWYRVAWLDEPLEDIRRATALFAERCEAARALGAGAMGAADDARFEELFGADEDGGGHSVAGKTTEDREVQHVQGAVWRRLRRLLAARGLAMTKPRHRDGYEVDGLISTLPTPILLEIKTSVASAAMQTGVGQLTLYPALLPRLKGARRVLLTRGTPRRALAQAVRDSGVELHSYAVTIKGGRVTEVTFDPTFLAALGLD